MFPNNMEFFGRERDHERLQEAEHIRLVKIARPRQFSYREAARKTTNWLGGQLIKWGAKLQEYGVTSLPKPASVEIVETSYSQAK